MLRAASLLEAGLHLLQRSRQVSPLAGKAITSGDTAGHQSGDDDKGTATRRKTQVASRGTGVALKANVSL
jgi:hypothetical protein